MKHYIGFIKLRFGIDADNENEAYEIIEKKLEDFDIELIDLEQDYDYYPNEDFDRERSFYE